MNPSEAGPAGRNARDAVTRKTPGVSLAPNG